MSRKPLYLKEWRNHRRLTLMELAAKVGTSQGYVTQIENGDRRYNQDHLEKFSFALGCTPADLLGYDPAFPPTSPSQIPIVGKAGASSTDGYYLNAYADGAHPTLDPYPEGSISVDVEGDSMEPRFFARESLIFGPITQNPEPYIGEEVLAYLGDDDGRTLIKILDRNRTTGNFNLRSYNPRHPIIEDVKVAWVRPFVGMRK